MSKEFLVEITLTSGAKVKSWCQKFSISSDKVEAVWRSSSTPHFFTLPKPEEVVCVTVLKTRHRFG